MEEENVNSETFDSGVSGTDPAWAAPVHNEEHWCLLRVHLLTWLVLLGKLSENLKIPGSREGRDDEQTEPCALCSDQEKAHHLATSL